MANVFRGKAQVSGCAMALDVIIYPSVKNAKMGHKFEEDIVQDEGGNDMARRSRNEMIDLGIGLIFVDVSAPSTLANAKSGAAAAFLAPYTLVTITQCQVALYNSVWIFVSGSSIDLANTATAEGEIKLERYVDPTQQIVMTSTPG